jgi:hypothetical protein
MKPGRKEIDPMQTTYQGKVSQREYFRALELHSSQLNWMKWGLGIFLAITIVSFVVTSLRDPAIFSAFLPGMVFLVVILSSPWWTVALQAGSYNKKENIYHAPIRGFINDYEITVSAENSHANILWSAFTHYKKADGLILLYQGKNSFNIFTKSMFQNEADWNQLLEVLQTRFPKVKKH